MRSVYLDNSTTTKLDKRVLEVMMPYLTEEFGSPNDMYELGKNAKEAIEHSRENIAKALNCKPEEIYFTSGGTESNVTAIRGIAYSYRRRGNHIITSRIEHPVVLETCIQLEKEGFEVTYIDVDENGIIDLEKLEDAVTDKTILITVMYANNEIGVIQPIQKIAEIARENEIFFHTDAVWAMGNLKIDVKSEKIDSLALSANKFYGPKGVGALYIRKGIKFRKLLTGGPQERNKRAGTENVPAIVGMGKAIELAYEDFDENINKILELRNYCMQEIEKRIKDIKINGNKNRRLPGNIHVSINYVNSEELVSQLATRGICVSNGNSSSSFEPSHVLLALQIPYELAQGSIEISIGKENTKEDIEYLLDNLVEIVQNLRNNSEIYKKIQSGEKVESCRYSSKCSGNCASCHK